MSSHFLIHTKEDVPNTEMFINKYPNFMNNEFELGYFIHLYTDKLWFDGFLNNFICNNSIKLLDGTIIETTKEEMQNMIYSDYTNMNIQLIDKYDMDLSLFYEEFQEPKTEINEIVDTINEAIDGKADVGHGHDIAAIEGLQDTLDSKADKEDIYTKDDLQEQMKSEIIGVLQNIINNYVLMN